MPLRGFYHPVLLVKVRGKLIFSFCQSCAKERIDHCEHDEEKRGFVGDWSTIKVKKAIEKGYKVDRIYEVMYFPDKSVELFKDYVRMFLKVKLEFSGVPSGTTLDKFVEEARVKQGVSLDKANVEKNPGRRAVAKVCLNSL